MVISDDEPLQHIVKTTRERFLKESRDDDQ